MNHRASLPRSDAYVFNHKDPLSSGCLILLRCYGRLCQESSDLAWGRVSLVHVAAPTDYNGMQLYVRPVSEVLEEQLGIAREGENAILS
jgi:hypothetical protein